jgi:tryptophan 6-halogenase
LMVHYLASDRVDTPFWRAAKAVPVPDSLRERLDVWRARLPGPRTIPQQFHGFDTYSWVVMLLGLGRLPAGYPPLLDSLDESKARAMFQRAKQRAAHLVETLPSQYEYLAHLRPHRSSAVGALIG